MARMIVADHDYVSKHYNLQKLKEVEELVAEAVQVCNQLLLESTPGAQPFNRSTFLSIILLPVSA
jgi:hypothetical protein